MRHGALLVGLALALAAATLVARPRGTAAPIVAPDSLIAGRIYQLGAIHAVGDSALLCMAGRTRSGRPAVMEPALIARLRSDGRLTLIARPGALALCAEGLAREGLRPELALPGEWSLRDGTAALAGGHAS